MNITHRSLQLVVMAGLGVVLSVGLLLTGAAAADAQQVDCQNVAYNETIIVKCTTIEGGAVPTPTPTPEPTPTATPIPEPTSEAEDEADDDGEDEVPDDEPVDGLQDTEESQDDAEDSVEERQEPEGLEQVEDETEEPDDDAVEPTSRPVDDGDADPTAPTTDERGDLGDSGGEAEVYVFDTEPDPPSTNAGLIAGVVAMAGIGAGLFLAARRVR